MTRTPEFDLDVTEEPDGLRISVTGELDAYTAPRLRRLIDESINETGRRVVVDLRHTSFVDSTALGVIVGATRKLRAYGGELVLDSPSQSVFRVLKITGVAISVPVRNVPKAAENLGVPRAPIPAGQVAASAPLG